MLYKANVPLIVKCDLIPKGQEIELSDEEAARFDPKDISVVSNEPPAPEPEPVVVPVEEMTLDQLRAKAKELGLSAGGSKADILERIYLHLETPEAEN